MAMVTGRAIDRRRLTLCVMLVIAGTLAFAGSAQANWHWSKPVSLPGAKQGISSISCPTTKLCVAAAAVGNPSSGTNDIFWTTNPAGGKGAWHRVALEPSVQPMLGGGQEELITSVSCAKAGSGVHCGAGDGFANFWQTGAPTSGHWSVQIPDNNGLVGVSCWLAYCAMLDLNTSVVLQAGASVVDSTSNVLNVTEPLSEASISCSASGLCAATDVTHVVAWTPNVLTPGKWRRMTVHGGRDIDRIACPSSRLCVATEGEQAFQGWIGVWHPGASTFKAVHMPASDQSLYDVSCTPGAFCAVAGSQGGVTGPGFLLYSSHPAATVSAWKRTRSPVPDPSVVSCASSRMCMVGDGQGGEVSVATR